MDDETTINFINVEGLEYLQYEVEVVVLDLTVPGSMGGEETIEKLLEIDPDVKAILASGSITSPVISDFKKHGFKDVLVKPYDIGQLDKIIQKAKGT